MLTRFQLISRLFYTRFSPRLIRSLKSEIGKVLNKIQEMYDSEPEGVNSEVLRHWIRQKPMLVESMIKYIRLVDPQRSLIDLNDSAYG